MTDKLSTRLSALAEFDALLAFSLGFGRDEYEPESDRRVAEERAKLLERLREPSEAMIQSGAIEVFAGSRSAAEVDAKNAWKAMLAQFEKENSHEG